MRFEPVLIVAHDLAVILLLPPVDVSGLGGQPNQAHGVIRIRVYRGLDLYRCYIFYSILNPVRIIEKKGKNP